MRAAGVPSTGQARTFLCTPSRAMVMPVSPLRAGPTRVGTMRLRFFVPGSLDILWGVFSDALDSAEYILPFINIFFTNMCNQF